MSLTVEQVQQQIMTYLEATECNIIEKSPYHVTVKLSPQADRQLTNRPYYWGFVDRTGVDPETLSFTFVFEPDKYASIDHHSLHSASLANTANAATHPPQQDSILSRYFGFVPPVNRVGPGRIPREDVTYGSSRLQQIWAAARQEGACVYLFEQTSPLQRDTIFSAAYEPWLGVCFKVEMACDVKREELHFLGMSLVSGQIVTHFPDQLAGIELSPRLPENIHVIPASYALPAAAQELETELLTELALRDYSWAEEAKERQVNELAVLDVYYEDLLTEQDEENQMAIREQYEKRRQEMTWQFEPKVNISAITCGLFHLRSTH
ncbi:YqhG family protein [Paenibacillus pini]|uniref:Uncharacterized protein n=1 Tax=Paenibacillus pini JCM 16418 TaxID=1236976 RepID=W7YPB4_9BACL|nr:YqhG family protein [Paenibacillus pini]GAF06526.1 hypothetical protein JCM16418_485 [Paenibacillus pini JCM 16418]